MKTLISLLLCFVIIKQTESQQVLSKSLRSDNITFIDSVNQFETIEDILSLPKFKNKIVYIDLWGTTCIPCIREFSYAKQLHDVYANKPVEFLYICYNFHANKKDAFRRKWKDLVKQHKLLGTHIYTFVLPPNKLIHEVIDMDYMQKNTQSPFTYGIPSYFIAKNGLILVYNAKKPSNTKLLVSEIDSIQNLK